METTKQIAESGYVLIVHRNGFRSTEVHGRYSHYVVDEAVRRLKLREDVQRVIVEDAESFQRFEVAQPDNRRLHDGWGQPVDVLVFPIITGLKPL
jgi:hypothetical protein